MAIGRLFSVSLQGEKKQYSKYEVSVTQRLDLQSQGFKQKEIQNLKQFPLWNCLPFHLNWSPPPFLTQGHCHSCAGWMNSKSLPAVPGVLSIKGGSVTLLSRDEFPASLQKHHFLGEGHKIPEIRNLVLSIVPAASSLNVESRLDYCHSLSYRNSSFTYGRARWETGSVNASRPLMSGGKRDEAMVTHHSKLELTKGPHHVNRQDIIVL